MEEIKENLDVGMYIRTKDGRIGKIDLVRNNLIGVKFNKRYDIFDFDDILKYSKNIVDLIQKGDYVNDCLVFKKGEDGDLIIKDLRITFNISYRY